jgi:hypothetical protein
MADKKLSQLDSLAAVNAVAGDLTLIVDVSDTSMAPTGTNKTMTLGELSAAVKITGTPAVTQADVGPAPNEVPLNQYLGELAYMNAEAVVIQPQVSVTPNGIGDMVFQLTSNTSLVIKVKGSDGVVRSSTLVLI